MISERSGTARPVALSRSEKAVGCVPHPGLPKVAVETLGCKLNQYDSEEILAQFREAGYDVTKDAALADVCVVNTCAVTATAERKARAMLRSMRRENPSARLMAVGCMPERTPETLAMVAGVDVILGNREKQHLLDFLPRERSDSALIHVGETAQTREVTGETVISGLLGRTRGFLKVQDGCSQKCTYCIIPKLRGTGRSLDVEAVVTRARHLVEQGFAEVVLTGVALGTYGFDRNDPYALTGLLQALEQVDGLERIRLGSVEPWAISGRMLTAVADSERICPHLHVSLQSCEDSVLRRMNRRYSTADIRHLFDYAYSLRDDWGFGTDIIVGFPGETEAQFRATQQFLSDSPVAYVHIFPYSSRPGTPATKLPGQVREAEKRERVSRLKETDRELRLEFRRRQLGRTHRVLFEHRFVDGYLAGHAANYLDVYVNADARAAGSIHKVKIAELHSDGVIGEISN